MAERRMAVLAGMMCLLLLGVIGLAGRGAPAAAQSLPTQTPVLPTATPFLTPTPTLPVLVVTPESGCAAPLTLTVGGQVIVTGGLNVRSAPSVSGALVGYIPEEKLMRLIGGPECANGYNWWRVSGFGEPGWIIEGRPGRYFIEQYIDPNTVNCFPTQPGIAVGEPVVAVTGSRVREEADPGARVITVAPPRTVMAVIDGPRCRDGLVWWRVQTRFEATSVLIEGWVGEGYPGDRWIAPLVRGATPQPCVRPLSWRVGTRGAAVARDGVPRRLRAAPDASAALVLELLDGVAFEVIEAPSVCSGGFNWWHVRVLTTGITGWIAEGVPGRYNVEVIVP